MNLKEEKKLWKKEYKIVAGLDEAGRGSLAGPVTACAVAVRQFSISLDRTKRKTPRKIAFQLSKELKEVNPVYPRPERPGFSLSYLKLPSSPGLRPGLSELYGVKDSKKLSPKKREELYEILTNHPAIEWGIGRVGPKVIDRINILEATKLAMKRAVRNLERKRSDADFLILDGKMKLDLPVPQKSIVKADDKVFSCAAASILAKVTRDRAMIRYHKKYPQYAFDKHKGYPTKLHQEMLKKHGSCKIHRKSFGPVEREIQMSKSKGLLIADC